MVKTPRSPCRELLSRPGVEIGLAWFSALISQLSDRNWIGPAIGAGSAGLGMVLGEFTLRKAFSQKIFGRGGADEARRQWARRLADASFDGLLIHRNGTILQMNRALVRMLGYREMDLLGTHFSNLAHPSQMADLRTELEAPAPQTAEFTLQHADKSQRFVEMASHTLEFEGLPATISAIRNLTAQKALEARLAHLTHNDALTGLSNRAMFTERLEEAVSRNDQAGGTTAVMTLQIPGLKAINAQLGRHIGDTLLRQIAHRLRAMADEADTVARLSGDKFGVVQPHQGAPNRTAALTSQIKTSMQEPFIVEGKAVKARMSIGIAIYPEHAATAEGLLNASGFALSQAGESGAHIFSHAEAAAAGFGSPNHSAAAEQVAPLHAASLQASSPQASAFTVATLGAPGVTPLGGTPPGGWTVKPNLIATQR